MLVEELKQILEDRDNSGLIRHLDKFDYDDADATPPLQSVDFWTNDYLSLTKNQTQRKLFLEALPKIPGALCGATGARTGSGNFPLHMQLERRLAAFHHSESALLFNSGFDANAGVISTLPRLNDIIVYDELIHASFREGIRASQAGQKIKFKHNSIVDVLSILRTLLEDSSVCKGIRNVFVIIETVYSMDGDFCPVKQLAHGIKKSFPAGNGYLIVDEAHATGLYGKEGRGIISELGIEDMCFARIHTFGKALGASGAVVLCCSTARLYLSNYARTFRFSTAQPAISLLAISLAYDFLESSQAAVEREKTLGLSAYLKNLLRTKGYKMVSTASSPPSPIVAVLIKNPRIVVAKLAQRGILVAAVTHPVVPMGTERLRISVHAANTRDEANLLVQALDTICKTSSTL